MENSTDPDELLGKVEALAKQNRELERQLEQLKAIGPMSILQAVAQSVELGRQNL